MRQARIQQLSISVANQIAAGEVIERPASIVKELLENALDAQADTIGIEIGFGGLNQVKISDNGIGIIADDLPLAIAPHATSKIKQLNDLYAITSMGFRGEALASIASVSKLSLSSKPAEQEHAMLLSFDGGVPNVSPCARNQGTTVDVRDIFFNAPVRKKFLKTVRSEYQAIEMVVKRFALSAPHIALTLKHDGKQLLTLPATTCEKTRLLRLRKLLGKEFIEHAVYLDVEQGGMRLHGWVSGHAFERSQNDKLWVYVNQRMVKDKLINHAIKQAYDGLLHPGRHPACVLYLTIAAELVDINVHPTKHEVRFQQSRLVHDFILSHLSQALLIQSPQKIIPLPEKVGYAKEVRETYIKQPLHKFSSVQAFSNNWIVLNQHFVVVILHEKPYLVDAEQAYRKCIIDRVVKTYPLISRPLLVPVHYAIDENCRPVFEHYQPVLATLGVQFDWIERSNLLIRTLPVLLPQLDINKFLACLSEHLKIKGVTKHRQLSTVLDLLIKCQSFDANQLNHDDKMQIEIYLQQASLPTASWCKYLDAEKCRELMHD